MKMNILAPALHPFSIISRAEPPPIRFALATTFRMQHRLEGGVNIETVLQNPKP